MRTPKMLKMPMKDQDQGQCVVRPDAERVCTYSKTQLRQINAAIRFVL